MRLSAAILAAVLVTAGCANQLAEREAVLRPFVGRSEEELVRSIGVPTRTFEAGGHRFLAYSESSISIVPGFPGFYPPFAPFGYYSGFGYDGGFPPQVVERRCETTFEVAEGRVVSFALRGNACGQGSFILG